MLSKNKIKYIHSLELKKNRIAERAFVAEGNKLVADMLPFFSCKLLVAKPCWMATLGDISAEELLVAEEEDIRKASFLKNPQDVLAVFAMPDWQIETASPQQDLVLALDGIQDPGNLGTILRAGEGAGVTGVVMNEATADIYNPKVIRSTMGSIYRMPFVYVDQLPEVVSMLSGSGIRTYAAHLDGKNSYEKENYKKGTAFLIGNEGNGLRKETADAADIYVRIPMCGKVESLNAAIASSVLMFEAARQRRE